MTTQRDSIPERLASNPGVPIAGALALATFYSPFSLAKAAVNAGHKVAEWMENARSGGPVDGAPATPTPPADVEPPAAPPTPAPEPVNTDAAFLAEWAAKKGSNASQLANWNAVHLGPDGKPTPQALKNHRLWTGLAKPGSMWDFHPNKVELRERARAYDIWIRQHTPDITAAQAAEVRRLQAFDAGIRSPATTTPEPAPVAPPAAGNDGVVGPPAPVDWWARLRDEAAKAKGTSTIRGWPIAPTERGNILIGDFVADQVRNTGHAARVVGEHIRPDKLLDGIFHQVIGAAQNLKQGGSTTKSERKAIAENTPDSVLGTVGDGAQLAVGRGWLWDRDWEP